MQTLVTSLRCAGMIIPFRLVEAVSVEFVIDTVWANWFY
jgi:hypothetical protein